MKAAIITGASVGIGRETAALFLADGYRVFNLSRRDCPLDGAENLHCDLASAESVERCLSALVEALKDA